MAPQRTVAPSSATAPGEVTLAASVRHAGKVFGRGDTAVTALDDLSLDLPAGRVDVLAAVTAE